MMSAISTISRLKSVRRCVAYPRTAHSHRRASRGSSPSPADEPVRCSFVTLPHRMRTLQSRRFAEPACLPRRWSPGESRRLR
jgi:hypothetical protein